MTPCSAPGNTPDRQACGEGRRFNGFFVLRQIENRKFCSLLPLANRYWLGTFAVFPADFGAKPKSLPEGVTPSDDIRTESLAFWVVPVGCELDAEGAAVVSGHRFGL